MTSSPCKHCSDRQTGCHGLCKSYNDWALKHKEEMAGERATMPKRLHGYDFTGTSPKPGKHRKTRSIKR